MDLYESRYYPIKSSHPVNRFFSEMVLNFGYDV